MKQLSKLSPAQTLLVLQYQNASIKELLKVTLMDLLLKQVVRTIEVQRQSNKRDTVRVYKYIVAGKNFWTYQPLPHEIFFLAPFQKSDSVQILFRHIVKIGYQNAKSESNIHNILRHSPNLDRCFSRSFIQSLFGGFSITTEGKELKNKIETEISQLEKEFPALILHDHQKAIDILKVIKGNVFLLTNIEFDLLKQIDKELLAEMHKRENNGDYSGCTWDSFDNYSVSFDSSCSGDSASSGCGGSGCSGCGGCGID